MPQEFRLPIERARMRLELVWIISCSCHRHTCWNSWLECRMQLSQWKLPWNKAKKLCQFSWTCLRQTPALEENSRIYRRADKQQNLLCWFASFLVELNWKKKVWKDTDHTYRILRNKLSLDVNIHGSCEYILSSLPRRCPIRRGNMIAIVWRSTMFCSGLE